MQSPFFSLSNSKSSPMNAACTFAIFDNEKRIAHPCGLRPNSKPQLPLAQCWHLDAAVERPPRRSHRHCLPDKTGQQVCSPLRIGASKYTAQHVNVNTAFKKTVSGLIVANIDPISVMPEIEFAKDINEVCSDEENRLIHPPTLDLHSRIITLCHLESTKRT